MHFTPMKFNIRVYVIFVYPIMKRRAHHIETQQYQDKKGKKSVDQNSPKFMDYINRYEDTGSEEDRKRGRVAGGFF